MRRDVALRYVFVVTVAAVDVLEAEAVLLLPLLLTATADLSGRNLLPLRLRLAMCRTPFSAPTACRWSQDA
jgi:hypothetical protein